MSSDVCLSAAARVRSHGSYAATESETAAMCIASVPTSLPDVSRRALAKKKGERTHPSSFVLAKASRPQRNSAATNAPPLEPGSIPGLEPPLGGFSGLGEIGLGQKAEVPFGPPGRCWPCQAMQGSKGFKLLRRLSRSHPLPFGANTSCALSALVCCLPWFLRTTTPKRACKVAPA